MQLESESGRARCGYSVEKIRPLKYGPSRLPSLPPFLPLLKLLVESYLLIL